MTALVGVKKGEWRVDNKYLAIYNEYAEKIETGKLRHNAKLPSENELAEMYGASRETVRKALNLLSQNGYIQKIKGKGSFVLNLNRLDFPVSGLVSFKELAAKIGLDTVTEVVQLEEIQPDPYIADQLHIPRSEPIWKVVRTREIAGEKAILDKDYFRRAVVPRLTRDICENSVYEYLEDELNITISFAKKIITVEEPSAEDRQLLDFNDYPMIVVVRNYVYLEDAELFQYTESRHRPDRFRFIDFARRQ